jgi:hypothetical protein
MTRESGGLGVGSAPGDRAADRRAIGWLLVAAAGLAGCITWLFLGMRAVLDIGGACAEGGPYVPVQPCPDGVPALMVIGMLGLFGFGGLGLWAGARLGGGWAALPLLAWPGLSLSLGWNFLEYGIAPPADLGADGPEWGWVIPGLMFVAMGAVPLWLAWSVRHEIRSEGSRAVASRFGMPAFSGPEARRSPDVSAGWDPSHRATGSDGRGAASEDVVDRLERLAELRRRGDLTSEEYDAAKRQLLGDDPGSSS